MGWSNDNLRQLDREPPKRIAVPRRPSTRVTALAKRLAAALLILAAGVAPLPIATGSSLPIAAIAVSGAHFLDAPSVIAASGIAPGENLLAARMRNAEMGIRALPMIASVQVRAGLPGTIQIDIVERTPLLRWEANGVTYLVDGAGRVVATTDAPFLASSAATAILTLPLVTDARTDVTVELDGSISAALFDAVTRLTSLTPTDVGSRAAALALRVDQDWGLLLAARGGPADAAWVAVFGTYTGNLRPPTMIPEQVRLLRSLLASGEGRFGWVILADARAGTYTDRGVVPPPPGGTPAPSSPAPTPGSTVAPSASP